MEYLLAQANIADIHRAIPRHRLPKPEAASTSRDETERAAQRIDYRHQVLKARARGVSL